MPTISDFRAATASLAAVSVWASSFSFRWCRSVRFILWSQSLVSVFGAVAVLASVERVPVPDPPRSPSPQLFRERSLDWRPRTDSNCRPRA